MASTGPGLSLEPNMESARNPLKALTLVTGWVTYSIVQWTQFVWFEMIIIYSIILITLWWISIAFFLKWILMNALHSTHGARPIRNPTNNGSKLNKLSGILWIIKSQWSYLLPLPPWIVNGVTAIKSAHVFESVASETEPESVRSSMPWFQYYKKQGSQMALCRAAEITHLISISGLMTLFEKCQ